MNAQSVWPGHDYAYVSYVRKKHFPTGAIKCKVISLRKTQQYGKERTDTLATVLFDESKATREVNVRNLYDFWDSYEDEREHVRQDRQRREEERVVAAKKAQEEAAQQEANKRILADKLAYKLGLDTSVVITRRYDNHVMINLDHLQFLLEDS